MARLVDNMRPIHSILMVMLPSLMLISVGCNDGNGTSDGQPDCEHQGMHVSHRIGKMVICLQPHQPASRIADVDQIDTPGERATCFRMSFSSKNATGNVSDVISTNISGYGEFADRVETLFFDLPANLVLIDGDRRYQAMGAVPDQDYGLHGERKVLILFPVPIAELKNDWVDVMYDDHLFDTGISHFRFLRDDLLTELL